MENKIPKAIGPYSAYRKAGNLLFTSGQLPINPVTNKIEVDNIYDQAIQSLMNIESILEKEGLTFKNVLKFTVFMKDLSGFSYVNQAFEAKLKNPYPARTAIEISKLPMDGLIEIEAIAAFD